MAISIISLKCPDCGSSLNVETGKNQYFCPYCGAKVLVHNENEHVYRHIDEAKIKKAESDMNVKLRKIETKEKEIKSKEHSNLLGLFVAIFFFIFSIIAWSMDSLVLSTVGAVTF